MRYIKVCEKMRFSGDQNSPWLTTYDFVALFTRASKTLNTGLNIFEAKAIIDACLECKEEQRGWIDIEESQYKLLVQDLKNLDFLSLGISGSVIAEDIKNVNDAPPIQPEDFDGKIEFSYPETKLLPDGVWKLVPGAAKRYSDNFSRRRNVKA